MTRFLPILRTIHSWLGVFILPWVLVIGLTGFYLNHPDTVMNLIGETSFSEAGLDTLRPPRPITMEDAQAFGATFAPDLPVLSILEEDYHGRPSYVVDKGKTWGILSIPTGHYYIKTDYSRRTYAPDGTLLHTKMYWGAVFKTLHIDGWLGGGMGTFFADAVALAMVLFGVTGSILFFTPRIRRLTRRLSMRRERRAASPAE